jgi:hypothetical protein
MHLRCLLPLALALAALGCTGPDASPQQVLALRQAQTKAFEVPMDTAFKAAMAYLQDNGYQIRQASKDSGLISATKAQDGSARERFWGALLAGDAAKRGDVHEVTFTFEAVDEQNTKVRCNLTHGATTVGGTQGHVAPVKDPSLYKTIMDAYSVEVQRRHLTTTLRGAK